MGRGLSELEKVILAEGKTQEVVLFQEMMDKLCPEFRPLEFISLEGRGDTLALFFDILSKRKTEPWLWASVREDKIRLPDLHKCVVAREEYERKRGRIKAALSRAFTRLEARGLVERVDVKTWHEGADVRRMDEKRQRGVRLTVKSDRPQGS